eukprot:3417990-Amphidinium_carterae.6
MDPFWSIDGELLTFMVGDSGAELLKTQWRSRAVDTPVATHDIEGAVKQSTEFMGSLTMPSLAVAMREELQGAHAIVQRVWAGDAVVALGHLLTPWLTGVCKALEGFIYYAEPEKDVKTAETEASESTTPSEQGKPVVGQQALELLFKSFTTKAIADVELKDLSVYVVWRHLLTDAPVDSIAKVRNGLMKTGVASKTKPLSSKPSKPAKVKSKASKDSQLDATARALLGMK